MALLARLVFVHASRRKFSVERKWNAKSYDHNTPSYSERSDFPAVEFEKQCSLNNVITSRPGAIIKNVYDKNGAVSFSEVCNIWRTEGSPMALDYVLRIPDIPKQDFNDNRLGFDDNPLKVNDNRLGFDDNPLKVKDNPLRINDKALGEYISKLARTENFAGKLKIFGINKKHIAQAADLLVVDIFSRSKEVNMRKFASLAERYDNNFNIEKQVLFLICKKLLKILPEVCSVLNSAIRLLDGSFEKCFKERRKVTLHLGPRDSLRNELALRRFSESFSALYICSTIAKAKQVQTSPNAKGKHVATIDYHRTLPPANVAVIDDVHMISDRVRGGALTSTILSAKAKEVHLCGEPEAMQIVKRVCREINDDLEFRHYMGTSKFEISSSLEYLGNILPGDCIMIFSEEDMRYLKKNIETHTDYEVALVYGLIPQECREDQINLFNSRDKQVILATNALTALPPRIKPTRLVFFSLGKKDGSTCIALPPSYVKHLVSIAACNSKDPINVCTFHETDAGYLRKCLKTGVTSANAAVVAPSLKCINELQKILRTNSLPQILKVYADIVNLKDDRILCEINQIMAISNFINNTALSIEEKYIYATTPVDINPKISAAISAFADLHAERKEVHLEDFVKINEISSRGEFISSCQNHQVASAYIFLSVNFPKVFTSNAYGISKNLEEKISAYLRARARI